MDSVGVQDCADAPATSAARAREDARMTIAADGRNAADAGREARRRSRGDTGDTGDTGGDTGDTGTDPRPASAALARPLRHDAVRAAAPARPRFFAARARASRDPARALAPAHRTPRTAPQNRRTLSRPRRDVRLPCVPTRSGVKANTQKKGGEKEKVGGGGAAGMAARTTLPDARVCVLCKASFNSRSPKPQLMEHVDSKHAKNGFDACFPGYVA